MARELYIIDIIDIFFIVFMLYRVDAIENKIDELLKRNK